MPERPAVKRARTAEEMRLAKARENGEPWLQWGPYLSERQWGTVREDYSDYSDNGDAWNSLTTKPAHAPIMVRMASPVSATTISGCPSLLRCGTVRIRFSRSGCSS